MSPILEIGDKIIVEKVNQLNELRQFDILVFMDNQKFICHYLWHINRVGKEITLSTRSLKEIYKSDTPFSANSLLGKVIGIKISTFTRIRILILNFFKGTA